MESLKGLQLRTGLPINSLNGITMVYLSLLDCLPTPNFIKDKIKTNSFGFIETDKTLMTSMPGLFAAGDVRAESTKQAASAAGEGATAALMIRQYLDQEG